ncbi:MAG: ABC transporter permease [Erysipelothrix sp.]
MYFKLAMRNVKKSYKDFFIYFITLTFSVSLFYVFNSFENQAAIMELSEGQSMMVQALTTVMSVMSVIVAFVFAFLILYANSFLIKRRKKELGLYTLLGMQKKKISLILITETLFIGVISLVTGLLLGYILTQGVTVLSAHLMAVNINYKFVFSLSATIKTILSFGVIFLIVMVFNQTILGKFQLIDLLRANRINEESSIKRMWMAVVFFVVGVIGLGVAYRWALEPQQLIMSLGPIVLLGSVSTFIIFKSFSGFLLKFMQTNKRHYYKGLNMFVLRQVSAKVNSTYKMMALISLMLLFGIGTLVTGFNLNSVMNSQLEATTPFDLTTTISQTGNYQTDVISKIGINSIEGVKQAKQLEMIDVGINTSIFNDSLKSGKEFGFDSAVSFAKLSEYNQFRQHANKEPLVLSGNQIYLHKSGMESQMSMSNVQEIVELDKAHVSINNASYSILHDDQTLAVQNGGFMATLFIVNDDVFEAMNPSIDSMNTIVAVDLAEENNSKVESTLNQRFEALVGENGHVYSLSSKDMVENMQGIELMFTYIGLYLGVVFLVSSVVVLALQQISEASDNQQRYQILNKIGVEEKMSNRSIFKQNAMYFMIPLVVALVHSYVGIKAVNVNLNLAGLAPTTLQPAMITMTMVLSIYLIYFVITYMTSKSIIKGK